MNLPSGRGAEELTVYSWNTKVSAPFCLIFMNLYDLHFTLDDFKKMKVINVYHLIIVNLEWGSPIADFSKFFTSSFKHV